MWARVIKNVPFWFFFSKDEWKKKRAIALCYDSTPMRIPSVLARTQLGKGKNAPSREDFRSLLPTPNPPISIARDRMNGTGRKLLSVSKPSSKIWLAARFTHFWGGLQFLSTRFRISVAKIIYLISNDCWNNLSLDFWKNIVEKVETWRKMTVDYKIHSAASFKNKQKGKEQSQEV